MINNKTLLTEAIKKEYIEIAIDKRFVVNMFYHGDKTENPGPRVIEVHGFGSTKAGNTAILAWQRSGASDTPDNIAGWRTFLISKITKWAVYKETFEPREPLPTNAEGVGPLVRIYKSIHDKPTAEPSKLSAEPKLGTGDKTDVPMDEPEISKIGKPMSEPIDIDTEDEPDKLPGSSVNKLEPDDEKPEPDTNYSIDDEPEPEDEEDDIMALNESIKELKKIFKCLSK